MEQLVEATCPPLHKSASNGNGQENNETAASMMAMLHEGGPAIPAS